MLERNGNGFVLYGLGLRRLKLLGQDSDISLSLTELRSTLQASEKLNVVAARLVQPVLAGQKLSLHTERCPEIRHDWRICCSDEVP